MFKEIGSEFWDVPTKDNDNYLFPDSTQWFVSGRSALQAIIKDLKNCRTVAMPSWCCDSMVKPFVEAGIQVRFYPVSFNGDLVQRVSTDCDALFLMDYFGYTGAQPDLTSYHGIVIRDVTHSLFSTVFSDADYYFGSLRKWCGVWTGGYAWTQDGRSLFVGISEDCGYADLRDTAMQHKASYINNPENMDKSYLQVYNQAEDILENVGIVSATNRDVLLAKKLDVEFLKSRRRSNAFMLREAFSDWLVCSSMNASDCPMFVPILVPDGKRDALRKYLIQHEIYCPIHWPVSEYHRLDDMTGFIYRNEISLVCDQRYDEKDMKRMIDTINSFWKEV